MALLLLAARKLKILPAAQGLTTDDFASHAFVSLIWAVRQRFSAETHPHTKDEELEASLRTTSLCCVVSSKLIILAF